MVVLCIRYGFLAALEKGIKAMQVTILDSKSLDIASKEGGIEPRESKLLMDSRNVCPIFKCRYRLWNCTFAPGPHGKVAGFNEGSSKRE